MRFERIVPLTSKRAADIVSRICDLSKKAPARKGDLEINETILEIMGLTRVAVSEHRVLVTTTAVEGLPHIFGDRIQLQQVLLNLIMECHRSDERGHRKIARVARQYQRGRAWRRTYCGQRYRSGPVSSRRRAYLRCVLPRPKPAAWGWDCRSAARSSKAMPAGYGQRPTSRKEPSFFM